jgi:hypothetical protein
MPSDLDGFGLRKIAQRAPVDVPTDRTNRSDLAKCLEDGRVADVTRMQNQIAARQSGQDAGSKESMSIADHPDP